MASDLQPEPVAPASFLSGVRASSPIVLGYIPIALAFGVVGRTSGFSPAEVGLMSWIVFAGASQFIGSAMFAAGAGTPAIVATTFLVNLRHLLMSTALVPSMRRLPVWQNTWLSHYVTDESFAVAAAVLQGRPASGPFMMGLTLTPHLTWILISVVGAVAGEIIGDTARLGLDFALPAMFIGLLMPHLRGERRRSRAAGALAAALSTLLVAVATGGSSWSIIAATLTGATVGVMLR